MNKEVEELSLAHSIETLYTGGSVEWSADGRTVFTTCTNVIKAINVDEGTTRLYTGGSVEWSGDGRTLFTTCTNVIKAINVDQGTTSYVIGDAEDSISITCAKCTPDGHSMVVSYSNGIIREYTLPKKSLPDSKPEMRRQWKSTHTAPVKVLCFSPNGTILTTGAADCTVKVWKMDSQNCIASLKGPSAVTEVLFTDNEHVMVGYMDGAVNLFKLKGDKKLVHQWNNHTSQVVSLMLLDKTTAACVSRDQTISLSNLETHQRIKTLPLFEPVESAVLIEDGSVLTVGEEGVLKCWHPTTGKMLRSANICRSRIDLIVRSKARDQLLLASCDLNLYVVDEKTFEVQRQMVGFNDEVFDLAFVGSGQRYMMVAANTADLRVYDTLNWTCHLVPGHTESILSVSSASWDQNTFVTSSKDNSLIVWRLADDEKTFTMPRKVAVATGHTNDVTAVRLSRTSKKHFVVSVSNDTTLKLWSLADVKSDSDSVKLSASSTLVAHSKDVTCVDVSVNDRLCVTGSMDKTAKLWHIDSAKMQLGIAGTLGGHRRGVWDARFSSTTQVVATCCGDCMVRVFSIATKECIATLSGHPSAVLKSVFVNNDKQLISADSGGLLKIWSLSAKDCVSTVEAHDDKVWTMLAYGDETKLVTGQGSSLTECDALVEKKEELYLTKHNVSAVNAETLCFVGQSQDTTRQAGSDGRIRIWEDVTEKKREDEERQRAQRVNDEQKLSNLMQQERYAEALSFSLTLSRPYSCLRVVNALVELGGTELRKALSNLLDDQLVVMLDFASQWNTNSRTSAASQKVLYEILHCYSPEHLLSTPNFAAVVESFIPYTNRHYERLARSRQNASFLNYTWSQMRLSDVETRT